MLNISCETLAESIRVVRFIRPDLREELHNREMIEESDLFMELHEGAIAPLKTGGTLLINFGLVDRFPSSFYRLLLKVRESVRSKGGSVAVCCLPENVKEGFELMGGNRLFSSYASESRAVLSMKALA